MSQSSRELLLTGEIDLTGEGTVTTGVMRTFTANHNLGFVPILEASWYVPSTGLSYPLPRTFGSSTLGWQGYLNAFLTTSTIQFVFLAIGWVLTLEGHIKYYLYKENAV